jgi:hypothetical protein
MITAERDEKVYCEARDALVRRGKQLGKPKTGADGRRRCPVDGALLTDRELYIEAWGKELADEILGPAMTCWMPEACPECQRLWQAYLAIADHLFRLLKAELARTNESAAFAAVAEPAKLRSKARSLLVDHAADHARSYATTRLAFPGDAATLP